MNNRNETVDAVELFFAHLAYITHGLTLFTEKEPRTIRKQERAKKAEG